MGWVDKDEGRKTDGVYGTISLQVLGDSLGDVFEGNIFGGELGAGLSESCGVCEGCES